MSNTFFFDNYALMSLITSKNSYFPYSAENCIINDFVFAEFCYNVFRDKIKDAEALINEIKPAIAHAKPEWIAEAMEFRLKWKDRNVSMTDCIGYIMAKKIGIKFLTGDKEFEDMENVEFVK